MVYYPSDEDNSGWLYRVDPFTEKILENEDKKLLEKMISLVNGRKHKQKNY